MIESRWPRAIPAALTDFGLAPLAFANDVLQVTYTTGQPIKPYRRVHPDWDSSRTVPTFKGYGFPLGGIAPEPDCLHTANLDFGVAVAISGAIPS